MAWSARAQLTAGSGSAHSGSSRVRRTSDEVTSEVPPSRGSTASANRQACCAGESEAKSRAMAKPSRRATRDASKRYRRAGSCEPRHQAERRAAAMPKAAARRSGAETRGWSWHAREGMLMI